MKTFIKQIIPEHYRIVLRLGFYKITSIFYYGNTYRCNSCNKSFRKLKPYGKTNRANACCPYCNSLERERLLKFYFTQYFQQTKPQKTSILHFAPEKSLTKFFKSFPRFNYYSADINPLLADYQIDICNISFNSNRFDIIICSHVLAHVQDEKQAIEEMRRVLHPDGFLLILTYVDEKRLKTEITNPENSNYIQNDKVYRYHGQDFGRYLTTFGFDVEEFDFKSTLDKATIEKYCLGNYGPENFYICRKKSSYKNVVNFN